MLGQPDRIVLPEVLTGQEPQRRVGLEAYRRAVRADHAEDVGVLEGQVQRAQAAHRQSADGAVSRVGQGAVALVDSRNHVLGDVIAPARAVVVPVGPVGRVGVVGHDDDHWLDLAGDHHAIGLLGEERIAPFGVPAARTVQQVQHGVMAIGRVQVVGRQVDAIFEAFADDRAEQAVVQHHALERLGGGDGRPAERRGRAGARR